MKPASGDVAILVHKVTVTDTDEYCREVQIGASGELEINAATADASVIFDDHADAKISFTAVSGILGMNGTGSLGTATYTASLTQAGTNRTWEIDLSDGTTTMDYARINYVKAKNGYIDVTDGIITINATQWLTEHAPASGQFRDQPKPADRYYLKGYPTTLSVDRQCYFENIYYGLENDNYSFQFTLDPSTFEFDQPVIFAETAIQGRTRSRSQLTGQMAWGATVTGTIHGRDDRFKTSLLEDMKESLEDFMFFSPRRIFHTIAIISVPTRQRHKYIFDYSMQLKERGK